MRLDIAIHRAYLVVEDVWAYGIPDDLYGRAFVSFTRTVWNIAAIWHDPAILALRLVWSVEQV